jgi:enoyl-CoA hydratase
VIVDTGSDQLQATVEHGIARVVMDNQPRMNALSVEMLQGLDSSLAQLDADRTVRVVVLSGAGTKAFVSGADISQIGEATGARSGRELFDSKYQRVLAALRAFPKPIISRISGYCLGGGVALALATDIRICDSSSQFGIPAARLGLGYGHVEPLLRVVGPAWAAEILFTGRRLSSSEAQAAGLVNRVVDPPQLSRTVDELADTIASNAPLTIAAAKFALRDATTPPAERDPEAVQEMVAACFASADFAEGARAFREKRPPRFEGR